MAIRFFGRAVRLRTSDGVDQNRANDRQRLFLEQLVKQKLAVRTSNGWALTARGFLVSNEIILQLLDRMRKKKIF